MYQVRHPMAIDSLLLQNILQRLKGIFSGELFFSSCWTNWSQNLEVGREKSLQQNIQTPAMKQNVLTFISSASLFCFLFFLLSVRPSGF